MTGQARLACCGKRSRDQCTNDRSQGLSRSHLHSDSRQQSPLCHQWTSGSRQHCSHRRIAHSM